MAYQFLTAQRQLCPPQHTQWAKITVTGCGACVSIGFDNSGFEHTFRISQMFVSGTNAGFIQVVNNGTNDADWAPWIVYDSTVPGDVTIDLDVKTVPLSPTDT
jgi:hypothetical protein